MRIVATPGSLFFKKASGRRDTFRALSFPPPFRHSKIYCSFSLHILKCKWRSLQRSELHCSRMGCFNLNISANLESCTRHIPLRNLFVIFIFRILFDRQNRGDRSMISPSHESSLIFSRFSGTSLSTTSYNFKSRSLCPTLIKNSSWAPRCCATSRQTN